MNQVEDTRRSFKWWGTGAIWYLLHHAKMRPINRTQMSYRRRYVSDGDYCLTVDEKSYELNLYDRGHFYIVHTDDVQTVYKTFRLAEKEVEKQHEKRSIIEPVLPKETKDLIQQCVFDFFTAIDKFGTTCGFGNVGIILTGPAGTGKSETMRWLADVGEKKFDRDFFKLSFAELRKVLAEGVDMNTRNSLVFIDDIDASILRDRRGENPNPLTSQFLTCLDGLDKREGRVIVVSTNEDIGKIDPALRRPGRFETIITYDYPNMDLIGDFCEMREFDIDPRKFEGWSFARMDMFISRFKVAEFIHKTPLNVFYEQFIYERGETDQTVEAYNNMEGTMYS